MVHGRPFATADVNHLDDVFTPPMNAAVVAGFADFIPGALPVLADFEARLRQGQRP